MAKEQQATNIVMVNMNIKTIFKNTNPSWQVHGKGHNFTQDGLYVLKVSTALHGSWVGLSNKVGWLCGNDLWTVFPPVCTVCSCTSLDVMSYRVSIANPDLNMQSGNLDYQYTDSSWAFRCAFLKISLFLWSKSMRLNYHSTTTCGSCVSDAEKRTIARQLLQEPRPYTF